ncbi:MAG: peptidylprolyl isomerase [Kribbellaceae bacterium]
MAKKKPYQRAERQRQAEREAQLAQRRQQRGVVIAAALSVLLVVGVVVVLALRGGDDSNVASQPSESPSAAETPAGPETPASIPTAIAPAPKRTTPLAAQMDCKYPKSTEPASKKVNPPANGKVTARGTENVTLATTAGNLNLKLDRALAPCAVNSFLSLTGQKYFDNTTCHRMTVTGLQVLQCGDPSGTGRGGPGYSFADEVFPTLRYGRGVLAMANSGPNTNGSQFFIVYGDASVLEPKYTAFGTVDAASLAVLDALARKGVTVEQPGTGDGKPVTPVQIKTAKVSS